MFMRAFIFFSLLATPSFAECLPVNEPISLSGYPAKITMPGPPEYLSVAKGDRSLNVQVLLTNGTTVCTEYGEVSLNAIQTTCDLQNLPAGSPIDLTGELFIAHTGYHWTPVLLDCQ
ncbi:DUF4431 domain-containing protein [uncultured Cohaesibacter sp.]|uniref:DUF4431 domain-containing protein n=1 Tax=uncultured Cohaesibacter sp. TaxID=1002546 RepID=UPI002AAB337C|nr:DUF4431 domain-containing protein [uncultured Cohaesibacter sp.]